MGETYRQTRLLLGAIALVALFQAIVAHSASSSPTESYAFLFHSSSADPFEDIPGTSPSPSVGSLVSIPVSEALLPVHHSQMCVELKQSKQASIDQLADQTAWHVRPVWLSPTGLRPIFAVPSLQILFCTWLT